MRVPTAFVIFYCVLSFTHNLPPFLCAVVLLVPTHFGGTQTRTDPSAFQGDRFSFFSFFFFFRLNV